MYPLVKKELNLSARPFYKPNKLNRARMQAPFFKNISKDQLRNHMHCAKLCKDVYFHKHDLVVDVRDNHMYVAVEGTHTFSNWVDNVSVFFKHNDVHPGFERYAEYCAIEYNPFSDLSSVDTLFISGHSSGAASVALLAYNLARDLKVRDEENKCVVELVLFGCPKIGGSDFKFRFNEACHNMEIFNYRNNGDMICTIPYSSMGYHDTFGEDDTRLLDAPNKPWWDVTNHFMASYIESLENLGINEST
jgi:hypothetical protein